MKKLKTAIIVTVVITYLLVLAGALVRATGSGMGCPDWPKCFGQYIPPTNITQLPANYKEIFKVQGKTIADFNAFHTWVEYLNRLLGVVEGFAILVVVFFAFKIKKENRKVWFSSLMSLLLVLIIGWVGSKVVSSNLAPAKITLHMILALLLVFNLIGTYYLCIKTNTDNQSNNKNIFNLTIALFFATILQIIIGTQVRQQVDEITVKLQNAHREVWIENLDFIFDIHKIFALVIVVIFWFTYYLASKNNMQNLKKLVLINCVLVSLEFIIGNVLAYSMPAFAQPLHIFIADMLAGTLFYTLLVSKPIAGNNTK